MFTSFSPVPTSPQLRIDTMYTAPDTALAAVVGEVDLATAQDLRDTLLNALRTHPAAALNVDLSGVTFLDCTGISALVAVRKAAFQVDCHMWATNPRAHRASNTGPDRPARRPHRPARAGAPAGGRVTSRRRRG